MWKKWMFSDLKEKLTWIWWPLSFVVLYFEEFIGFLSGEYNIHHDIICLWGKKQIIIVLKEIGIEVNVKYPKNTIVWSLKSGHYWFPSFIEMSAF